MAKKTYEQVVRELQNRLVELRKQPASQRVPGGSSTYGQVATAISTFLTTGQFSGLDPYSLTVVNQALNGSEFQGKPGAFQVRYAQEAGTGQPGDPRGGGGGGGQGGIAEMVQQGDTAGLGGIAGRAVAAASAAATGQKAGGTSTPPNAGAGYVDEFGGMLTGPGAGQSQRPSEAGIASQVAREQARVAAQKAAESGPPGGGSGNPGNFTDAQGLQLAEDDDRLVRFALQAAGLNPDRMNSFTRIVGRALVPLLRARRAAFGINSDATVGGLPQDIASFAKEFTTPGVSAFGNARAYADSVMGSENFKSAIAGLSDQDQVAAMFQSLLPLRYAGSNPLIQQSAADTFQRTQNQYNDQLFNVSGQQAAMPGGGIFVDWLNQQQNLDPITRRIFGIR